MCGQGKNPVGDLRVMGQFAKICGATAIPARKLATKAVKVGNSSGRADVDKFTAFDLAKVRCAHQAVAYCRLHCQSGMQRDRHALFNK